MTRENYRSIGAIIGLATGLLLMVGIGLGGMIPGALFGAGGAVFGGISGERLFDMRRGRG